MKYFFINSKYYPEFVCVTLYYLASGKFIVSRNYNEVGPLEDIHKCDTKYIAAHRLFEQKLGHALLIDMI